jgi:hypothetical protein
MNTRPAWAQFIPNRQNLHVSGNLRGSNGGLGFLVEVRLRKKGSGGFRVSRREAEMADQILQLKAEAGKFFRCAR